MNFNKIVIVGNLTRDPETRTLPSGQTLTTFSIATNRVWTDQAGEKKGTAEFHNIVAFGKLAEICSRYLSKGRLALIEGRIQTRSWQDPNGNKRYRTEVIAENMQMGPKGGSFEERQPEQEISQEDIPVIEAEEPIEQEIKEEVDVKNIPF